MSYLTTDEIIDRCERFGTAYEASREVNLAANAEAISLFRTNGKFVLFHARELGYNGIGIDAKAYRDPVITNPGSLESTTRNANDLFKPTDPLYAPSTVQLYVGPTYSSIGTETRAPKNIFSNESNQGSGGAPDVIETPQWILTNKDLILYFKNRDTNNSQRIFAEIRWCEITRVPGLIIQNDQVVAIQGGRV